MAQSSHPAALAVIGERSLDQSWKVIGAGGFGQVFKTRHLQWRWDVAIKLLGLDNGSFSDEDLLGEAEMMRRAESPYVIRVLGVFRGCRPSNNLISVGLVMELMERGALDSLQKKLKDLPPWSLVFRLVHQVALGMNYLHSLTPPMIHRDLKPANVLLDSGLNVKITDFGLAKFVTNVTATRIKGAGTRFFMPPEAFSTSYTSACSFDVYSYAMLLWSLLNTGNDSDPEFDVQRGGRPPLDVAKRMKAPGLEELIKLMESCWHQNPRRRPTFSECTAVTEGLYGKHQRGINDAVYQVQKKQDQQQSKLSGGELKTTKENNKMIDNLKEEGGIRSKPVEKAFRGVDRADYCVDEFRDNAYNIQPLRHGHIHLSAPNIYTEVMEALDLHAGLSFLNLGSGTGYLNTLVGLILGPMGVNHGVELYADVVEFAQTKLDIFVSKCDLNRFCKPCFVTGNGLQTVPFRIKYDRVYAGAAVPPAYKSYMMNLVKRGGILVMPLENKLMKLTQIGSNDWTSENLLNVVFADLVLP